MSDYKKEVNSDALDKLNLRLKELPPYCEYYFIGKANTLAARTRLAYADDLEIFFYFIKQSCPELNDINVKDIPIEYLKDLKVTDIERYLSYLERYTYKGEIYENGIQGKRRKLAAVRELYKYLIKIELVQYNPAQLVDTPKVTSSEAQKNVIALKHDEKVELLNEISNEALLTKKQLEMKQLLEDRDKAIILLFLGTGIRVSELVGLDIEDVNFKLQYFFVLGKGNKLKEHYFNQQIADQLLFYLECIRPNLKPAENEKALFISRRGTRLTVRSVEILVKKYSGRNNNVTTISPHKLRSTYGTDLLEATGDIALVSDNLGHSDISTTKRYYMGKSEARLRKNKDFNII